MNNRVAIIDMGTNTFHLLIAEIADGKTRIIYQGRQAVKIGKGGINNGMITEAAIARALQTLTDFKATIEANQATRVLAFGTSALRNARNGTEIIERIKKETGIETRLISGEEEAKLIYHGIRAALDLGKEKSLIVDIGGGSVEFIIAHQEELFWKASFEIGGQRLLELFQQHDPIRPEEIEKLQMYLEDKLRPLFVELNFHQPRTLVGSSGTFDTLSEIFCVRNNLHYQPEHGETPFALIAFDGIHKELIAKDRRDQLQIPGMIDLRVDMIVVASCLIRFLLDRYPFEQIRVSTYSLKEGVLTTLTSQ
jgi:exopolyphosphatase / guanosine-5'-triphosphate,3'-diphosphate pyrophosphatase